MDTNRDGESIHDTRYSRSFEWHHNVKELVPADIFDVIHQVAINFRLRDETTLVCLLANIAGLAAGKAFILDQEENVELSSSLALVLVGSLDSRITDAIKDISTLPLMSAEKQLGESFLINPATTKRAELPLHLKNIDCCGLITAGVLQTVFAEVVKHNTAGISASTLCAAMDNREVRLDMTSMGSRLRGGRNSSDLFQTSDQKSAEKSKSNSVTFNAPVLSILGGLTPAGAVESFRMIIKQNCVDLLDHLLVISVFPKVPTAREQRQGSKDLGWTVEKMCVKIRHFLTRHKKTINLLEEKAKKELPHFWARFRDAIAKGHPRSGLNFDAYLKKGVLKTSLNFHILFNALRSLESESELEISEKIPVETVCMAFDFVSRSWKQLLTFVHGDMDVIFLKMKALMIYPGKAVCAKEFLLLNDNRKLFSESLEQVVDTMKVLEQRKYGRFVTGKRGTEDIIGFVKFSTEIDPMKLKVLLIDTDEFQYSLTTEPPVSPSALTDWKSSVEFLVDYDSRRLHKTKEIDLPRNSEFAQVSAGSGDASKADSTGYEGLENDDLSVKDQEKLNLPEKPACSQPPEDIPSCTSCQFHQIEALLHQMSGELRKISENQNTLCEAMGLFSAEIRQRNNSRTNR